MSAGGGAYVVHCVFRGVEELTRHLVDTIVACSLYSGFWVLWQLN
jgi:hypothetical protein